MKNSIYILILFIIISLSSCKKECAGCQVPCVAFDNLVTFYCLSDFNDTLEFELFIDSLKQYYPIRKRFEDIIGFCEDEQRIIALEAKKWKCNRYKD